MIRIRNTSGGSLRLAIGAGLVLDYNEEVDVRDEYERDTLITLLVEQGMLKVTSTPPPEKPGGPRRSRFDREDPI